jgi:hypothetical protein
MWCSAPWKHWWSTYASGVVISRRFRATKLPCKS